MYKYIRRVIPLGESVPPNGWKSSNFKHSVCLCCHTVFDYTPGQSFAAKAHYQRCKAAHPLKYGADRKRGASSTPSISRYMQGVGERRKMTISQKSIFDLHVAKWISQSARPFRIVEDKGLKDMVTFINH
jgi:hypothetical protein